MGIAGPAPAPVPGRSFSTAYAEYDEDAVDVLETGRRIDSQQLMLLAPPSAKRLRPASSTSSAFGDAGGAWSVAPSPAQAVRRQVSALTSGDLLSSALGDSLKDASRAGAGMGLGARAASENAPVAVTKGGRSLQMTMLSPVRKHVATAAASPFMAGLGSPRPAASASGLSGKLDGGM